MRRHNEKFTERKAEHNMKTNIFDESWRQSVKADYKADRLSYEKANKYALIFLSESLEIENRIEGERIFCPEINTSIILRVVGLGENKAGINFVVYSPEFGDEMYEHSVGIGDDTVRAVEVAVCSFVYSFMDGFIKMCKKAEEKDSDAEVATIFAGKTHKWRVHSSDVATIGNAPDVGGAGYYWDKLKKLILKRLGNKKVSYIKVYLERVGGEIVGECRVDSVLSTELSVLLVNEVAKWKVKGFASHKLYFFICQDDETSEPYPYFDEEGRILLKKKIKTAVDIFYNANTDEKKDQLLSDMKNQLGDDTLAFECYSFIPEFCAENAFRGVKYSEKINLIIGDKPAREFYKNQLNDYWLIHRIFFNILNSGVYGNHTQELYQRLVETSAIKNAVDQMAEKGVKLEDIQMKPVDFRAGDYFEIR